MEPGASGRVVSDDADSPRTVPTGYDFARLEAAVSELLQRQRVLQEEKVALTAELDAKRRQVRTLDAQLLEANQLRQDIVKHVDELISQLDELEAEVASLNPGAFTAASATRNSSGTKVG